MLEGDPPTAFRMTTMSVPMWRPCPWDIGMRCAGTCNFRGLSELAGLCVDDLGGWMTRRGFIGIGTNVSATEFKADHSLIPATRPPRLHAQHATASPFGLSSTHRARLLRAGRLCQPYDGIHESHNVVVQHTNCTTLVQHTSRTLLSST